MVKGFLGKAFSIAGLATIALPLVAAAQMAGYVPGGLETDTYVDFAQVQMIDQAPATGERIATVQPDSFHESYSPAAFDSYQVNKKTDSNISVSEAIISYAASAAFGGAGIGMAAWKDKKKKLSEELEEDGDNLGAIAATAGEAMKASNRMTMVGSFTNSKAAKDAGAAMAVVAMGVLAAIPPYVVTKSVKYNFFNRDKTEDMPDRVNDLMAAPKFS